MKKHTPKLNRADPPDVLIVFLPQPEDLRIARECGWYRVRSAEMAWRIHGGLKQFSHLAFYQPDSFGPERRCIRYFAPILDISSVRRIDLLPDQPRHPRAQQQYLRFGIGSVEPLPHPILSARGRRILFIPTSWTRIANARDINDLFAGSPIEDILYARLRNAALLPEREYHVSVQRAGEARQSHYFLDLAVFCARRNLDIECDGDTWHAQRETIKSDNERDNLLQANLWHVLRFNTAQLTDDIDTTVTVIREATERYGGVLGPGHVVRHFDPDGKLGSGQGILDL